MAKAEITVAEGPPRRSFVTLPLAQLVPAITRPAFKKRSPASATLMAEWGSVVGPQLALITEPKRLSRGTLTIACAGPVAMELQHLQASLMDRINVALGQVLVEKLRFTQDHVAPPAGLLPKRRDVAAERVDGVGEGALADALSALQQAMRQRIEK